MNALKLVIEFVMDVLETIVFIGSLFIVIYLFILQPNQIKGASMEPTFITGEYILTSKITYKFRGYHRGDIVVFKSLQNPNIDYIKRIIGLPGDVIRVHDGEVFVNDQQLNEPYLADRTNVWERGFTRDNVPITIPEGMVYVMGDHRTRSSDSREFGPIPVENIIGQVFYRYFPMNKMGYMANPFPKDLQALFIAPFANFRQESAKESISILDRAFNLHS